jgi:hypothetical protein
MISPEHDPGRERERALEVHETPLAIEREIGNKMGEAQDPGNIGLIFLGKAIPMQPCASMKKPCNRPGDRQPAGRGKPAE